jgi:drug/metabolite transporter (DMT)-like permease
MLILLVALIFEAIGVVFLSQGLKEIGEMDGMTPAALKRVILQGISNRKILLGVLFEAIFFAALLVLLSRADVSLVWPLTSLGFLFTTMAAKLVGHEKVTSLRWAGVILIVMGALLVGWSEKQKKERRRTNGAEAVKSELPG